jgi:hypothetical protein
MLSEINTIDGDKRSHGLLQIFTFPEEMKTFTFDDFDELVIKRSVDEKAKNQLQGEEDESSSLHSLSCMQQECQPFTFHERCLGERSMIHNDINVIEHIENQICMNMAASSSNPMEVELKSYGSFEGKRNPLFEPSHQIGDSMSKRFYDENNHDKKSNGLAGDLMEEYDEGKSNDVFIPSLCSKSLDGNFFYGESVYFNPLFLDEDISINTSEIGVKGQSSMVITPQVASHQRLYEGNPIQGLISLGLNHHKDLQKDNFDINARELEVMTNHVDDAINITPQYLRIQDDFLEDKEEEIDHEKI